MENPTQTHAGSPSPEGGPSYPPSSRWYPVEGWDVVGYPAPVEPRRTPWFPILAVAVTAVIAAGGLGYAVHTPSNPVRVVSEAPTRTTSSGPGAPSTLAGIAKKVDPGLVDIMTTLGYEEGKAAGTGMVLSSTGEVLTNNHVINGATVVTVTDVGNRKTYKATVVGYDRSQDVAVIQLQHASGLETVHAGSTATVGEPVVGIGNAGGRGGTPSVAGGSITAKDRTITAQDGNDGTTEQLKGLLETNAPIEPGDSGGPLVNTAGEVLGMDTAASEGFSFRTSGSEGFSIPIATALGAAKQISAGHGSATVHIGTTAFLGVEVTPTGSQGTGSQGTGSQGTSSKGTGFRRGSFGATPGTTGTTGTTGTASTSATSVKGVCVAGTIPSTPAATTALLKGDVITTFGGTPVTSADDLSNVIGSHHPGDKVTFKWVDPQGTKASATVTLIKGPAA